ncbi:SBBP repeat-containing protein [Hymenobacter metallilatus]|uniref:T9SS C-terminal target domain-containing protein n=1 Tax=Hymenobacter metallilatus TaxID=2493666 RepID=A0A3R9M4U9_9BACT|nr:SBBP repeat-containing protein [Hymenobacter metallilatus]RSK37198.1 hypothetical protein EI290_00600 [Hymenobacter metallilatus]
MKALVLFLCLLSSYAAHAQATWQWVNQLHSTTGAVSAKSVAADGYGGSFVTGSFQGTIRFNQLTLTSRGQRDLFVVRYDAAGRALWAVQVGQNPAVQSFYQSTAAGADIAVDAAGNAYVVGNFTGTLSYAGGALQSFSEGFNTGLVLKLNGRGQVQWAQRFGITQFGCYGYAIATDAAGNSYITGQSDYGNIQFGNQVYGPGSRRVMYAACYRPTGTVAWAQLSSNFSTYGASGADVALDGRGSCYVGGFFNNDMTLAGTSVTTVGADSYLASFNAVSGGLQWLRQGGGTGTPTANNSTHLSTLATDRLGNVYAAGDFSGTSSVGGKVVTAVGQSDIFLARYTPAGAVQWVKTTGTSAPEYSTALVTDAAGYTTLLGRRLTPSYDSRLLLHSFQPDGSAYYADVLGTSGSCAGNRLAQQPDGQLYLTSDVSGSASFGSTTVQVPSGTDGVVGKFRIQVPAVGGGRPGFEVFPNPARGRLVARLSWARPGMPLEGQALLSTTLGRVVASAPLQANSAVQSQAVFDASALPAGLYVVQFRTADGMSHTQSVEVK